MAKDETPKKCEEPNGIRNIRTFITADALLAAILLVWAQMWAQPALQLWSRYYQLECGNIPNAFQKFNNSVGFGLTFTYFAVFLALVALAWVGWQSLVNSEKDNSTSPTAIGIFASSLILGIINVAQSFVSVAVKVLNGDPIYSTYAKSELPIWFLGLAGLLFVVIVILPICGVRRFDRDKSSQGRGKYLLWKIEAILILFLAGFWLYSGWVGFGKPCNIIIASLLAVFCICVVFGKKICVSVKKIKGCFKGKSGVAKKGGAKRAMAKKGGSDKKK